MKRSVFSSQRSVKAILFGVLVVTAYQYSRATFDKLVWAELITKGFEERPFAYRALVPWLAHLLVILGMRADWALSLVIILSAIGLFYGIQYLLASFCRP